MKAIITGIEWTSPWPVLDKDGKQLVGVMLRGDKIYEKINEALANGQEVFLTTDERIKKVEELVAPTK